MQSTWQYPSTRRRGRPPRIYCDTDMSTDNYFSGLSDDDNGDPGPYRSKRSRKDSTSQNSTTAAVPKKPPAPKRPPPIIIPNLNHAQVIEILKTAPINNKQYSKRLTSDGFKIFTENVQDYKQLKSHLASIDLAKHQPTYPAHFAANHPGTVLRVATSHSNPLPPILAKTTADTPAQNVGLPQMQSEMKKILQPHCSLNSSGPRPCTTNPGVTLTTVAPSTGLPEPVEVVQSRHAACQSEEKFSDRF